MGALSRRRVAALRGVAVPALRRRERLGHDGRTPVYAADDSAGTTPVFSRMCVPALPPGNGTGGEYAVVGAPDEDGFAFGDTGSREAVMPGAPHEGGEIRLYTGDVDAAPPLIRTSAPVRLPGPGRPPAPEVL